MVEEDMQDSNELFRKFWEIENLYFQEPTLSIDKKEGMEHFKRAHYQHEKERVVVSLPVKGDAIPLSESRTVAALEYEDSVGKISRVH